MPSEFLPQVHSFFFLQCGFADGGPANQPRFGARLARPLCGGRGENQRQDEDGIRGYQRPAVTSHIAEIRAYLESDAPLVPNAIVIAFDKRVRFEPTETTGSTSITAVLAFW